MRRIAPTHRELAQADADCVRITALLRSIDLQRRFHVAARVTFAEFANSGDDTVSRAAACRRAPSRATRRP